MQCPLNRIDYFYFYLFSFSPLFAHFNLILPPPPPLFFSFLLFNLIYYFILKHLRRIGHCSWESAIVRYDQRRRGSSHIYTYIYIYREREKECSFLSRTVIIMYLLMCNILFSLYVSSSSFAHTLFIIANLIRFLPRTLFSIVIFLRL